MRGCETSSMNKWELLWADEGVLNVKQKKEKEDIIENLKLAGTVVGGIAAAALVGWGLSKIVGVEPQTGGKKMMKAPGRNMYIPRAEFESNPGAYFRNLRLD